MHNGQIGFFINIRCFTAVSVNLTSASSGRPRADSDFQPDGDVYSGRSWASKHELLPNCRCNVQLPYSGVANNERITISASVKVYDAKPPRGNKL